MSAKVIQIVGSDSASGRLILSPAGTVNLYKFWKGKVRWEIADPNIESFRIEGKTPGDPFTSRPPITFEKTVDLEVSLKGRTGEWEYSIIWKHSKTHMERPAFDPKIAVNPIINVFIIPLLLLFIGFTTVMIVRRNRFKNQSTK